MSSVTFLNRICFFTGHPLGCPKYRLPGPIMMTFRDPRSTPIVQIRPSLCLPPIFLLRLTYPPSSDNGSHRVPYPIPEPYTFYPPFPSAILGRSSPPHVTAVDLCSVFNSRTL